MKIFFLVCVVFTLGSSKETIDDTGLNTLELIENHGYPLERHENIITEDGYILEMQRIPCNNCPPVLLMHGLFSSSADWVNEGNNSLAFILSDEKYDVWLGNERGVSWSSKHQHLNSSDKEFWSFSWHEIGKYDLPAMIDHIISVTNQSQIYYIGHSQGTTTFFVMTSERPEYNSKIRLMSALSPVVFMNHMENELAQSLSSFELIFEELFHYFDIHSLQSVKLLQTFNQLLCYKRSPVAKMCENFLFLFCGHDSEQLDPELLSVIFSNSPEGTSVRQILHYGQGIKNGGFKPFSFSYWKNLELYGALNPPDYNLANVIAPVALYYAKNDLLSSIIDVEYLMSVLPNVVHSYLIPFEKFNHLDFLYARDVFDLLFKEVLKQMKNY